MRTVLYRLALLCVGLTIVAGQSAQNIFISHEGIYRADPTALLRISVDPSGILQCTTEWTHREGREESHVTSKTSLNIRREAKFLGYWDQLTQTFWLATEKQIFSESWAGTTNYISATYDHTAKTLEKTPEVFRKEVRRIFKSP